MGALIDAINAGQIVFECNPFYPFGLSVDLTDSVLNARSIAVFIRDRISVEDWQYNDIRKPRVKFRFLTESDRDSIITELATLSPPLTGEII